MEFPRKRNAGKVRSRWVGPGKTKTKFVGPPKRTKRQKSTGKPSNDDDYCSATEDDNFFTDDHDQSCEREFSKKQNYGATKQKEFIYWEKHNTDYLSIFAKKFENIPSSCCFCIDRITTSFVWCKSCGPLSFYCIDCAQKIHKNTLFHSLVEIQVFFFFNIIYD